MRNTYRILPLVLAFMFFTACAKDVGNDGVEDIAKVIATVSAGVVDEGLIYLSQEHPEAVDSVVIEIQAALGQLALYNDGSASVSDIANSLNIVLTHVSTYVKAVDTDKAEFVARLIVRAQVLVEIYLDPLELPAETAIYANAFGSGIVEGLTDWMPALEEIKSTPAPEIGAVVHEVTYIYRTRGDIEKIDVLPEAK